MATLCGPMVWSRGKWITVDADHQVFGPFTRRDRSAIDGWQQWSGIHPFDCPYGHGPLLVLNDGSGIECDMCGHFQNWVFDFMLKLPWKARIVVTVCRILGMMPSWVKKTYYYTEGRW